MSRPGIVESINSFFENNPALGYAPGLNALSSAGKFADMLGINTWSDGGVSGMQASGPDMTGMDGDFGQTGYTPGAANPSAGLVNPSVGQTVPRQFIPKFGLLRDQLSTFTQPKGLLGGQGRGWGY